ncbi:Ldh family oxidoreductase [Rhizobium lentis]|uniref:Ldh family oxidoreductase n=1 Tax=Rhizobium lentis TaxID=1138194 RepID=A0A9Q3QXW3_9HYPH|nr:Ldh family oxidoreductase [Rhizobium lentis]MBX4958776.1 Ldh family oxidoreductase [Rhizobium lentis]MBX4976844.1 Ldh family oxidoreductase [Rhizobium lentis]MBX4988670.1 Ldh family oxidoreductase [Rhizobium lentis]MBX5000857.1 Ldh family oxidoreductase [Rhizobium lentis]MBX5007119.1 Ldh family oxidoreductase [Rhizobium lentis]
MRVTETAALALASRLLEEHGAPRDHAALQARVLVTAEMKGHPSHGLSRLPRLVERMARGVVDPRTKGTQRWRADAALEVEGSAGFGPVVAMAAIERLAPHIPDLGIGLVVVRNANHLGMLAHYVEAIAALGLVGIALSSSEALVHPFGGTRAMLGTNPIAIGVPTAEDPLVLDLATSIVPMGRIHHHAATGRSIPEGWARDAAGKPTTDPRRAKAGAIAPFGGAKGYGLGIAIELLVAALAGSALAPEVHGTLDSQSPCNKGDVFILIEPSLAPGLPAQLSAYLDAVRASPSEVAGESILVPGDRARQRRAAAGRNGFEIDERLWDELNALSPSRILAFEGQRS